MRAKLTGVILVVFLLTQLILVAGPIQADVTHVVQRGETLYSIARRYGTSVQAISSANGISNPNHIWVGQRLRIPSGSSTPPSGSDCIIYVVKRGDTLAAIAWKYGVTVNAIVQANGLGNPNFIYAGQRLCIPATAPPQPCESKVHVVQRGETLSAIAWRYGVSIWDIVAANNLSNPNFIYTGQRLIVPGACLTPSEPSPPSAKPPSPKPTITPIPPGAPSSPSPPGVSGWAVRVLYNDNEDHPVVGIGSTLAVTVKDKDELPVTINLSEFYETSMPTGSKPELEPYSCEFAPLQAGTWTITPKDLGITYDIYLDGAGRAHVEFYPTSVQPPQPQPPQPLPSPQPPVQSKMKSPEYGMHAFLWWRPEIADRDLQLIQQAGFGWVKQTFAWREIEGAGKGQYNWARADRVVNQAQQYGLRIIARVDTQPKWAGGGYPTNGPPNNMQDYADFVKALAKRYKGRIHAYQIWNEPNLKREWGNKAPNPAGYTNMLKRAYNAIKSVDPNALVITAGLAPTTRWDNVAMPDTEFVKGMYNAGAKGYFDALGVHAAGFKSPPEKDPGEVANDPNFYNQGDPNCPGPRCRVYSFRHVEDLRQIMVNRGDGNRQIVVLEFGWTTDQRANSPYRWHTVSQQQQGDYLVRAYQYAKAHWSPWIGLMSLIYMPKAEWTQADEQYWWAVIDPAYPELHLRPAYVMLKNMLK